MTMIKIMTMMMMIRIMTTKMIMMMIMTMMEIITTMMKMMAILIIMIHENEVNVYTCNMILFIQQVTSIKQFKYDYMECRL